MTQEQFNKMQEMTAIDVQNLQNAMYQDNHWCSDTGEWVDSGMWNFAQMLHDNYDLDDADDVNVAKEHLIEFFDGVLHDNDTISDEDYNHFITYTEGFLEDFFEGNLTKSEPITDEEEGHFLQIPEEYLQDDKPGVSIEMYMENNL